MPRSLTVFLDIKTDPLLRFLSIPCYRIMMNIIDRKRVTEIICYSPTKTWVMDTVFSPFFLL